MDNRPEALYQVLSREVREYFVKPPVEVSEYSPPATVKAAAAEALLDNFCKKFIQSSPSADRTALNTFLTANKNCEGWVSPARRQDLSETDLLLMNQFQAIVGDFFLRELGADVECTWANICENARSGPGASVGGKGQSFYAKHFSSPLTATSWSLIEIYKAHTRMIPEFSNAELIRQEEYGSPAIVRGSRISFVPKTLDTSRLICVEPTVNMYLQLGLGEIISKRLSRYFGINLETQPSVNRWLAYLGSEGSVGSFSTIDLKSASDSISLGLLGFAVPGEWQSAIIELRSPETAWIGEPITLNMVSSMGNGFTFPLQTALFSCVVAACYALDDPTRTGIHPLRAACPAQLNDGFSVFGDDIVVKGEMFHRVVRLLNLLGFTANTAKSFNSGGFRESCGHDYYHGYNIRPVFMRKLDTDQDIAVLANLLNEWSSRTGIYVPLTVRHLLGYLRRPIPVVPFDENMDSGLRVPYSLISDRKPERDQNNSTVYRRYVARPPKVRIGEGRIHVPKGVKRLIYNPSGLLMSYLRGEIRSGAITVRANRGVPYDTKLAVTPYWDWQRPTLEAQVFGLGLDKARWDIATTINLQHCMRDIPRALRIK